MLHFFSFAFLSWSVLLAAEACTPAATLQQLCRMLCASADYDPAVLELELGLSVRQPQDHAVLIPVSLLDGLPGFVLGTETARFQELNGDVVRDGPLAQVRAKSGSGGSGGSLWRW